jgi:CBS domain-containing protein
MDLTEYVLAEEGLPVGEVVRRMRTCRCSTALITGPDGSLAGIFTERDVLHKAVTHPANWPLPVRELMTPDPVALGPRASVRAALRQMTEGHFRDLPVVGEDGKILGNLTDNAIVRHLADHLQAEVLNLPPDPDQTPDTVEGA